MPSRRTGCLRLLFWFAVFDAVVLFAVGQVYYNLDGDLHLWAFQALRRAAGSANQARLAHGE